MNNLQQIVLCPNPLRDLGLEATLNAKRILENAGHSVVICPVYNKKHGSPVEGVETVPFEEAVKTASLMVVFGGDGSILSVARRIMEYPIPIIGVNMGHKGFMADLEPSQTDLLLRAADGDCKHKTRMMINVELWRNGDIIYSDCALNETVISGTASPIDIKAYGDESKITEYQGDGIIVATPTGSTAYSLSAGGPLVEPTANNIILTPICAHLIAVRPYVLVSHRKVKIVPVAHRGKNAWISVDGGQPIPIYSGDEIRVTKSKNSTIFAEVSNKSFYDIAYEKLGGRA